MYKKEVVYIALLMINILFIILVDITTFKVRPDRGISANGNPGIIVLTFGVAFFLILVILTYLEIYRMLERTDKPKIILIPVLSLVFLTLVIIGEVTKVNLLREKLRGLTNDEDSAVYHFGWINQYTNTLFFNQYILIAGISLSVFLAWVIYSYRNK
ncbi:hypothetical protein [Paenibacillus tuaregi]|uniref:hypothetical protein n=1 Tax=Paenibacillus tuaregi TaxID=1816681 RepID=UPI0008383BD6|nr:hypothetical protein [Paenibacillus tuaregi]